MNFLAHAVLAGEEAAVVAGSLAGDFVKGVLKPGHYPERFLLGVRLHRRIDAVSNRLPALRAASARLPANLRRWAPPCIDVMFDHFLARDLAAGRMDCPGHSGFAAYRQWLYELPGANAAWLSDDAQRFFRHARDGDLWAGYADAGRALRAVAHLCERLRQPELTAPMTAALESERAGLNDSYKRAWPELRAAAEGFCAEHTD